MGQPSLYWRTRKQHLVDIEAVVGNEREEFSRAFARGSFLALGTPGVTRYPMYALAPAIF